MTIWDLPRHFVSAHFTINLVLFLLGQSLYHAIISFSINKKTILCPYWMVIFGWIHYCYPWLVQKFPCLKNYLCKNPVKLDKYFWVNIALVKSITFIYTQLDILQWKTLFMTCFRKFVVGIFIPFFSFLVCRPKPWGLKCISNGLQYCASFY